MSKLLKALGAYITKPSLSKDAPTSSAPVDEKYQAISRRNLDTVAQHYADLVTPDIMYALMGLHDFTDKDWGSRHFSRMQNLCTNILDIEIHDEDGVLPEGTDKAPYIRLFFWLNLFRPIAMARIMRSEDWLESTMRDFDRIAVQMGGCGESTREAVETALLRTTSTEAGDVALDIYHDACRIEDTHFGHPLYLESQRTKLGRSVAFTTGMTKCARENLLPKWVPMMEKKLKISGFSSVLAGDPKKDELDMM